MTWRDVLFFIFIMLFIVALMIGIFGTFNGTIYAAESPYSRPPWIHPDHDAYWEKRMALKPESKITRKIIDYLKSLDFCVAKKEHGGPYASRGEPDVDCVYRSVPLKLEVKTAGKGATLLQEKRMKDWREAGAVSAVVYSVADVQRIVSMIDDALSVNGVTCNLIKVTYGDSLEVVDFIEVAPECVVPAVSKKNKSPR